MNVKRHALTLALPALLAACGGGSGSSGGGGDEPPANEPRNVALPENGGQADANYNQQSAGLVNDGIAYQEDSNEELLADYWQGNVEDDFVVVNFDRVYEVSEFSFYTNMAQQVNNEPDRLWVAVSADGDQFEAINLRETCDTATWMGRYRIRCQVEDPLTLKALRVHTRFQVNAHNFHVAEIEAWGVR
ncbi:hypothetical protein ACLD02_08300 [Alloalcanivorax sp. C16-2]|uniref:hypothetical protein n=1 Tax=Alloalcanivorax TaxID=3020832 RepID=UPI0019313CFB|nr:hypothetical protein [Alloalcanivorax marinus]MBL7249380.1 hypothetical protein [Alloalcanivorax marinus]